MQQRRFSCTIPLTTYTAQLELFLLTYRASGSHAGAAFVDRITMKAANPTLDTAQNVALQINVLSGIGTAGTGGSAGTVSAFQPVGAGTAGTAVTVGNTAATIGGATTFTQNLAFHNYQGLDQPLADICCEYLYYVQVLLSQTPLSGGIKMVATVEWWEVG